MNTVIITGVQGMDGSILTDKFLAKGYRVVGLDMWQPTGDYKNLDCAFENENFIFETGDITEKLWVESVVRKYRPDMLFHMAAISLVPESFKIPYRVFEVNTIGVLNFLEAIRMYSPHTRFYNAATSEMIGDNTEGLQNTDSHMLPNSPYAISKLASYHLVRAYRKSYGLFAVNGMLFNHEGSRRGATFVTRKITLGIADIVCGKREFISLGNLNSSRDWGLADNFCDAIILMLEADEPDDYTIATGETHTIREFVEEAFRCVNINITWEGEGLSEVGVDDDGVVRVRVNKKFYRPAEVHYLHGDYSKAKELLGWEPTTKFSDLVRLMIEADVNEKNKKYSN